MSNLTVKYRNKSHHIHIDTSKRVCDFKLIASERTGIHIQRFSLQIGEILLLDDKPIWYYIVYGTEFTMVDVRIGVTVIINGRNYSCNVRELSLVGQFANDLIRLANLETELSIYYNNERLPNTGTMLYCGVPNNATLTVVNGAPIKDAIRNITVNYRENSYSISIEKSKKVIELKKAVSKLTGIMIENFCLKFYQIFLLDTKEIETYNGNTFTMENVTINVIVILKGNECPFFVNERTTIDEFRTKIMAEAGSQKELCLYFNNNTPQGTDTILGCGIENNSVVIVINEDVIISNVQDFTVTYRTASYPISIETFKTVLDLKKIVSDLSKIKIDNFSLRFYWLTLDESKSVSEYIQYGTNFSMSNVTIGVTVRFEEKCFNFYVREEITVNDFKTKVNERLGDSKSLLLSYNGEVMEGNSTLLAYGVENDGAICALSTLLGG